MLLGDLILGTYDYRVMLAVYAALALPILMAGFVRRSLSVRTVLMCTVSCSAIFFAVTNLAVWYFGSLYSHDAVGLVECYVAALPFFKFTLTSDLLWSAILFGAYHVAQVGLSWRSRRLVTQPSLCR